MWKMQKSKRHDILKNFTREILCISLITLFICLSCKDSGPLYYSINDKKEITSVEIEVIGIIPADGDTNVPIDTAVSVTFNSLMDTLTVTVQSADGACSGSFQLSADNFITCVGGTINNTGNPSLVFTPAADLDYSTTYKMKILNSVESALGVSMTSDFIQNNGFTTESLPPFTVTATTPADSDTDVSISTTISVTFNRAATTGTITANTADNTCSGSLQVSLNDFSTCVQMAAVPAASNGNQIFTVTPAVNLYTCYIYKIRVTTAARDSFNNALPSQFTHTDGFTIQSDTSWTENAGNPLFGGATDGTNRAYYPCVIKVGTTYHIWYGDGTYTRHAASTYLDFHDQTFPATIITLSPAQAPGDLVYHPRVLYNSSGWYVGGSSYSETFIMYATNGGDWNQGPKVYVSSDGQSWAYIGTCTGVNSYGGNTTVYTMTVLYDGTNTWKGYADNGLGHIQSYSSLDGLAWNGQVINNMTPTQQAWEKADDYTSCSIIKIGITYILIYGSGLTVNNQGIGIATSTDGYNFTKDANNPLLYVTSTPSWRDNRTYTGFAIQDGNGWIMYFTGRSSGGIYSIGYMRRCGVFY